MATFNYEVNVGGNFKPYESALKKAIKTTRLEFSQAKEEWENVTIKTSSKDNFISDLKSLYEITKEFSSGMPIKFDPASKKILQKKLNEVSDLNIAINEKSVNKAKKLLTSKFDEIFKLYSDYVPLPDKNDYVKIIDDKKVFDEKGYKSAKTEYDSITSSRNEKVLPILKDIIDYNRTLLDYGVIDEKVFAKVLGNVKNKNEDVINDLLMQAQKNKIDLAGGVNLDKLFQDSDSTLNGLSNFIKVLNRFAGLDETMKQADESKFAEYSKQRVNQIREDIINKQKAESALSDIDTSTTNKINGALTEASNSVDKITNSVKELNAIPIKIDDESINEFYEKLNKLSAEPTIIKASIDPEVKEQLENLLKIKEDLKASGTIYLKLSSRTINSVNELRDKIDSLKYDVISSMSQPLELKGDVSEQFKTSINELKDTLDSIANKSRTIRFKISEATNRDITDLNERLNSLSQKLIAESKEVSDVLETTAKQSEVSISNIPTVKINVNADSIDELAYKIISLEDLLSSVVSIKGKVDDSIYTEIELLKTKLADIEERTRIINFKIDDGINAQISKLKAKLNKITTDKVLDGTFKIDASVVSALSDNSDIIGNLQKIDDTLNNAITSMKAANTTNNNVQENLISMGIDSINRMASSLDKVLSRINVALGYEVAPEEIAKVRKMLSNAQKSRKLNAETRKPLKAANAKLNALSHADELDHTAIRNVLNESYKLLGIDTTSVEKVKEVPVYVEKVVKVTEKATQETKEYTDAQDVFNNSLKEYKTHMNAIAGLNIDPAFDVKKANESQNAIESSLDAIAKLSDVANKEDVESKYLKVNSDALNKFSRAGYNKLSKLSSQITSNSILSSNVEIVEQYESLQKRLNEVNEGNFYPEFIENFYNDLKALNDKVSSELSVSKSNANNYKDTLKLYKSFGNTIVKLEPVDDDSITQIKEYQLKLDELKETLDKETSSKLEEELKNINAELNKNFNINKLKKLKELQALNDNPLYTDKNQLESLISSLESLNATDYEKINEISASIRKLFESINNKTIKEGNVTKLKKIIADLNTFMLNPKYSGISKPLKQQGANLLLKANNLLDNENGFSSEQLARLNDKVIEYKGSIESLGKTMSTTANVAFKLSEMNSRFIAQFFSFYDLIRYARAFLNVIVEIDTAIGELRKVSNETDERLAVSLKNSTATAKELGASISEIVNATSDWSRLGYGIDEAEQLAKVSQLYVNVGDGIDMDSANESLISTLQGFQLPVEEAETIIDKFNEVGNNYAIDTAGIGEALQRSAASFYAANTDLSKSIALVTTANTVLQNPETVGTTFKTLSARLRGASSELEELGEETDAYVETTSKLRDLVKGLTGFDIMIDENTYKDVYDILVGIGKEWDNLTDVERASLGEALAGKRNSNALYAVLQNIDLLESVYKTAENSAGSAAKEQENYAKTIQYSINVFKASAQELATNILDSAVVKSIVEAGIDLVTAFSNFGTLISPFVSLLGEALTIIIKILSIVSSNPLGALFEIGALVKYLQYMRSLISIKHADTVATIGEKVAVDSETGSEITNAASKTANKVATDKLTLSNIKATVSTQGLKGAIDLLSGALKGLSTASKIALAITAVFSAIEIGKKLFDRFTVSTEELKEKAESSANEVAELESELSSIETQIDTLNAKESLSFVEQDELDRLNETKASLESQLKLKQLIAAEDAKKLEESAVDDYNKKNKVQSKYKSFEANYYGTRFMVQDEVSLDEELQLAMNAYDDAKQKYLEEIAKGDSADSDLLKDYQKSMDEAQDRATEIAKKVSANTENITGVTEEGQAILDNATSISANYELFMAKVNNTAIDSLSEAAKRLYVLNKANESNVGDDIVNYLTNKMSSSDIDKLLSLDGFTFDKVETLDDLKELLNEVNNTVEDETKFDLGSMFEESENKASTDVTLADLQAQADVLKTINESLEEGQRLTTSTLKEILDNYPEAEESLRKYMVGLIDEQTLFDELKNIYATDQEYYNQVLRNELANSHEFMQAVLDGNVELYNAIKDVYGDDYANFKSLAEMKLDLEQNLIHSLLKAWAGYADVMSNMTDGLTYEQYESQLQAQVDSKQISEEMMAEYLLAWDNTSQKYVDLQNKINEALNNTANYDLPDTSWQTLSSLSSSDSDSSSSETESQFDWIERVINRISIAYNRLKNVVSDTTDTWLNRNNALENSIRTLSEEISAQQQAYSYYMTLFNQANLSTEYKNLIANGRIAVETITNSDLADAINEAQDWYDKAQSALDEVQNLGIELKELSKTRFDNVKSEYEEFINQIEHSTSMLQNQQDLLEAQGYLASTALYSNLITTEQKNLELLVSEYNALMNAMNQFTGEKYSETWYDMQSDINSVAEAIQEAQKQLVEYNNEMRQVKWDSFDRVRDTVQDIIDESEFMYGLLEKNKLLDEKGYFNANGVAAQALLAEKYNVYMNQADAYAKEILEIDKELATDPYNTKLIDRRQELLEAQRDAINGANSEKDALRDLIEEAYNKQLDSLQSIIDKYKEMIQTAKDAYDYEKNVGDQVENIASLEKQLNAYTLDNSEEGMLRRQQLTTELEEAKEQLQETEYDRLISDTENLLDQITTEFEDWMNARLDNVDLLLQEVINQSNANASSINDTIQTTANEVGYTITSALSNIWDGSSGLKEIMILYQNDFNNQATTINNSINSIGQAIINILNKANETSEQIINDVKNGTNSVSNAINSSSSASTPSTNSNQQTSNSSNSSSRLSEDIFWHKRDSYPKSMLNINTSIVDRLKYNDFDSSFNARAHYWESLFGGAYTGAYGQNVKMLDWLKQNGYAKGIRRLHSSMNGYAWTNEDGEELIRTSDGAILTPVGNGGTVFNSKMTDTLWDFAKNPADYIKDYDTTTVLREGTSQTIDVGGFNIQVVANNPEEFARGLKNVMAKDVKAQKMIQEIVLGQTIGNNTLSRNKYL